MKVYVVMEYAVIGYEEYHEIMCVCSSVDKAKAAIAEYAEGSKVLRGRREYNYYEYEVDQVWSSYDKE